MLTQRIEEASKLMDGLQVRLCSACRPARCSLVLCSTAALLPVLVRPAGSPTHLNLRMPVFHNPAVGTHAGQAEGGRGGGSRRGRSEARCSCSRGCQVVHSCVQPVRWWVQDLQCQHRTHMGCTPHVSLANARVCTRCFPFQKACRMKNRGSFHRACLQGIGFCTNPMIG